MPPFMASLLLNIKTSGLPMLISPNTLTLSIKGVTLDNSDLKAVKRALKAVVYVLFLYRGMVTSAFNVEEIPGRTQEQDMGLAIE